jgi:hypothetical protein
MAILKSSLAASEFTLFAPCGGVPGGEFVAAGVSGLHRPSERDSYSFRAP